MPPICVLSGEPSTRTVRCYFQWQERPIAQPSVLGLVRHYLQDVRKAAIDLPMSDRLLRRRRIGWTLFGLATLLSVGTIACLAVVQMAIPGMPDGVQKRWWRDIGVPLVAAGGSLLTGLAAWGCYAIMPMPTKRLKVGHIDRDEVRLAGASPDYLERLPSS